jgi:ribosomal protein L37AE/L43A
MNIKVTKDSNGRYRADPTDLPGTPANGLGRTHDEAIGNLVRAIVAERPHTQWGTIIIEDATEKATVDPKPSEETLDERIKAIADRMLLAFGGLAERNPHLTAEAKLEAYPDEMQIVASIVRSIAELARDLPFPGKPNMAPKWELDEAKGPEYAQRCSACDHWTKPRKPCRECSSLGGPADNWEPVTSEPSDVADTDAVAAEPSESLTIVCPTCRNRYDWSRQDTGGWLCGVCRSSVTDKTAARLVELERVAAENLEQQLKSYEYDKLEHCLRMEAPTEKPRHDENLMDMAIRLIREGRKTECPKPSTDEQKHGKETKHIMCPWCRKPTQFTITAGDSWQCDECSARLTLAVISRLRELEAAFNKASRPDDPSPSCPAWVECSWKHDAVKLTTLEPVAVEDITPGWYWLCVKGEETRLTHLASLDALDMFGPLCKWYRAPSPEELMAMCQRAADTDAQHTTDQKATIATAVRILREKWRGEDAQNKCADELEAIHGSRVPTSDELDCAEKLHVAGWTVRYNDEVIGHSKEGLRFTEKATNTRPCGKCAKWEPDGDCDPKKYGQCDRGKRCVDSPSCKDFTEKQVEPPESPKRFPNPDWSPALEQLAMSAFSSYRNFIEDELRKLMPAILTQDEQRKYIERHSIHFEDSQDGMTRDLWKDGRLFHRFIFPPEAKAAEK